MKQFHESLLILRNAKSHMGHCELVELAGGASSQVSSTYGINSASVLCRLTYFDPVLSFPMDIMHVLFEGVVPLEISLLLAYLIDEKKLFTVETLNSTLTTHHYGYSETDTKPTPIERDSPGVYKIRQSGKF